MASSRHLTIAAALAVVMASVVGAGFGWARARGVADQEISDLSLAHEMEMTGLCANALTLVDSPDRARLSALLQQRLDSALRRSSSLVDRGARLGVAAPNLRDSARRAAAHYERQNDIGRKQEAERLLETLTEER